MNKKFKMKRKPVMPKRQVVTMYYERKNARCYSSESLEEAFEKLTDTVDLRQAKLNPNQKVSVTCLTAELEIQSLEDESRFEKRVNLYKGKLEKWEVWASENKEGVNEWKRNEEIKKSAAREKKIQALQNKKNELELQIQSVRSEAKNG